MTHFFVKPGQKLIKISSLNAEKTKVDAILSLKTCTFSTVSVMDRGDVSRNTAPEAVVSSAAATKTSVATTRRA